MLATETPVLVFDMWRWEMLEEILRMDGAVIPAAGQVPLCDTHDRTTIQKQLGSCRNIRVEGNQLVGRNFISSAEQDAATKVKEGHVTDCSVGYRVLNSVDIEPGKTLEVNGEAYTAGARPLRITTEWELSENSLCPIGADVLAKVRAERDARKTTRKEAKKMTHFEKWLETLDVDRADLTEDTEPEYRRLWKLDKAADEKPADPPAEGKPERAESPDEIRTREIRAITPRGMEAYGDELVLRIDDATKKPITIEQARTALLEKAAETSNPAGSPEPPDPSDAKPGERKAGDPPQKVADVPDDVLKRSLTG